MLSKKSKQKNAKRFPICGSESSVRFLFLVA